MMNSFQNHLHQKALDLSKTFQRTEFELIDILQKIKEAKVFLALGYDSLYSYAHECLGLSEANSYAFSAVAKKANQVPELKAEIKSGNLTVSKAKRLLPVITVENKHEWIERAVTLSKAELERKIAEANPESLKRETIRPIANDRFSLKLGISEDLVKKLKRAQVLLMNKNRKNLSLEQTLALLTEEFLKKNDPVEKAKRLGSGTNVFEHAAKPGLQPQMQVQVVKDPGTPLKGSTGAFHPDPKSSRLALKETQALANAQPVHSKANNPHTPAQLQPAANIRKPLTAQVKHAIFLRDEGQCQFMYSQKKCGNSAYIEIHHKRPVASGGPNAPENLVTLCSRHHRYAHDLK